MSRKDPDLGLPWIRGDFSSFEDLRQLDGLGIDVAVHLGAVTGGATERDCILVNMEGTRCLMRYLIDQGCTKFVNASSIAAIGFQNPAFRPQQVPIPDEHPCFDRHGYGLSKYLMEEVTRYIQLQNQEIDVINLRLSSVCADVNPAPLRQPGPVGQWALGGITMMVLSDAVRAFSMAATADFKAGVRIMNTSGPKAWVAAPVAEILRSWWGDDVDISYFEAADHKYDAVFDVNSIRQELGFVAAVLP